MNKLDLAKRYSHRDARESIRAVIVEFGLEGNEDVQRHFRNFIWKRGRLTANVMMTFSLMLRDALESVRTRERRNESTP